MIKIIILGNYTFKNSLLHQLDSRSKILFILLFSLSVFLTDKIEILIYHFIISLVFIVFSKLSIKEILRGLIPIFPFLIFSSILQIIFYGKGEIIYSIFVFNIYSQGLAAGAYYISKILIVLLLATVITNSTNPTDLTEGLKYFLKPLKHLGLPIRDIATSISIAITFIPIIFDEASKIRNAQLIRGGNITILKFHVFVYSIILPIIINTLNRANKLALTMELRGYNLNPHLIQFKNLKWSLKDTILIAFATITLSSNVIYNFLI